MIPFLAPAAAFLSPVGNFLKRIPDWVIWVVAAVVLLKFVDINAEMRGRRREKDSATAKTIDTVRTIEKEARHDADAAIEARDSAPRPGSADGVPDQIADRIFRD